MSDLDLRTGNECCATPRYEEEDVCRSCGNRNVKTKSENLTVRLPLSVREMMHSVCEENDTNVTKAIDQFLQMQCNRILAAPALRPAASRAASLTVRITPELAELLLRARTHSGLTINKILEPLFEHAVAGYLHPAARKKEPYNPKTDCCPNENRGPNGGCLSCGDPSY